MRYTPLGWAKKYEFTESDLKVACDMLDTWIDSVAMVLNYFHLKKIKLSFYIHVAAWPIFLKISSYKDVVYAIIFRDVPIFLQKKCHGMRSRLCCHSVFMEAK